MKALVGRLQDSEEDVRIGAIEGVTAAAKHGLALLDGTLAPLNEARTGHVQFGLFWHVTAGQYL